MDVADRLLATFAPCIPMVLAGPTGIVIATGKSRKSTVGNW